MKIVEMAIDAITPYSNNPRRNDVAVDKVAMSIKEFGWQQPIVVDSDHVVIIGHTRLKAAHKLGIKEVPVHVADDLKPDAVKLLRIADNKTGEYAEWDMELLIKELEELRETGNDLTLSGFEEDEISKMVKELDNNLAEFEGADVKVNKVVSQIGDVWELGNHQVRCGTSLMDDNTGMIDSNFKHAYPLIIFNFHAIGKDDVDNNVHISDYLDIYSTLLGRSSADVNLTQFFVVGNIDEPLGTYPIKQLDNSPMNIYRSYVWNKDKTSYNQGIPCHHVDIVHGGNKIIPLSPDNLKHTSTIIDILTSFEVQELPIPLVQQLMRIADIGDEDIIFDPFGRDASTLLAAETLNKTAHIDVHDPRKCDEMIMRWQVWSGKDAYDMDTPNCSFNEIKKARNG